MTCYNAGEIALDGLKLQSDLGYILAMGESIWLVWAWFLTKGHLSIHHGHLNQGNSLSTHKSVERSSQNFWNLPVLSILSLFRYLCGPLHRWLLVKCICHWYFHRKPLWSKLSPPGGDGQLKLSHQNSSMVMPLERGVVNKVLFQAAAIHVVVRQIVSKLSWRQVEAYLFAFKKEIMFVHN